MSRLSACPEPGQLVNLSLGKIPRLDLDQISEHVERCPACQERLRTLDTVSDPLLHRLRGVAANQVMEGEAVPAQLLSMVCDAGQALPGGRHGKFELLEELGMGSFGQCFVPGIRAGTHGRAQDPEAGHAR